MDEYTESTITCRRATSEDATPVRLLIGDGFEEYERRYGSYSVRHLIETSYFTVTALSDDGEVMGLAAFNDYPSLSPKIPAESWHPHLLECYVPVPGLSSANTLWMVFFAAATGMQDTVVNNIFATLYTTLPDTDHVLFALPAAAPPFSPVSDYFTALKEKQDRPPGSHPYEGQILWSPREHVVPSLLIRKGKVEDYDDVMPLLLAQSGVLTEMGDDFFLEELLEHQDAMHCVLVAEDSETSDIVGLMCTSCTPEDQQFIVKHFNMEPYHKLKRWQPRPQKDQAYGNRNAFRIDFFYLNVEYESRAMDFLHPAFDQFPFAEYCYIRLPHSVPDHALLSMFQYVPLKQGLTVKQGCFLLSRYALSHLQVQFAGAEDTQKVEQLLASQSEVSRERCEMMKANLRELQPSPNSAGEYIVKLLYEAEIVGLIHVHTLSDEETFHLLSEFDIDSRIDFLAANPRCEDEYRQFGLTGLKAPWPRATTLPGVSIVFFYVKPIFQCHTRLFLREALRTMQKQVLYYKVPLADEVNSGLMAELSIALPRRQMSHGSPLIKATEHRTPATLHFTCRRLLSEVKTRIHSRIVVVGASTTGLSCIFTLLSLPYLHFTNIVLISRDGLPEHPDTAEHIWFTDTLSFLEQEYTLFQLKCKVRIIQGTLLDFERTEKYVVTDNGLVEPYDHLVITAGRQYTVPKELCPSKELTNHGIFPLSSDAMIQSMMQHVKLTEIYEEEGTHCVIYGSSLDSYCTLTSLIKLGIPPTRLVVVSPVVPELAQETIFHDPAIEHKVHKLCEAMGIKVYKDHELERLEYNEDNNLSSIYITSCSAPSGDAMPDSNTRSVEIPCTMLVYCHEKDIDPITLSALNKRSIVFDGRVIVENNYRTTDKHIYAAGPIAMFSRRFGPSQPFETYSSMEVGKHLCHTILAFLGVEEFKATMQQDEEEGDGIDREQLRKERRGQLFSDEAAQLAEEKGKGAGAVERPKPLPVYKANLMWRVTLPGVYYYFHCQMQSLGVESLQYAKNISTEDETGNSYIRISIESKQYMQSVSYLGSSPIEVHDLKGLVGMPQTYLNLVQRWDDGLITDLVSFLRQSWARAIYYDKMAGFLEKLKAKFRAQSDVQMLSDYIQEHSQATGTKIVDEERRQRYGLEVLPQTQRMVELELIKFLHQNKEYLPIYFLPDISSYII